MGVLRRAFAVLVVPVVVIGAGGGYLVTEADERAQIASQTSELVVALEQQDRVLGALARERALVIATAGSCRGEGEECPARAAEVELLRGVPEIGDEGASGRSKGKPISAGMSAQERTQLAIEERDAAFAALSTNLIDPRVQEAIDQARFTAGQIGEVQAKIAQSRVATAQATSAYDMFLADSHAVGEELLRATEDRDVALLTEAYLRAGDVLLTHEQERVLVQQALRADSAQEEAIMTDRAGEGIAEVNRLSELAAAASTRAGGAEQLPPFDGAIGTIRELIVSNQVVDSGVTSAAEYATEANAWATRADTVRDGLRADAVDLAAAHASKARSAVSITLAATAVALVLVVLGVLVALRGSGSRPAPRKRMISLDLTPVPGA